MACKGLGWWLGCGPRSNAAAKDAYESWVESERRAEPGVAPEDGGHESCTACWTQAHRHPAAESSPLGTRSGWDGENPQAERVMCRALAVVSLLVVGLVVGFRAFDSYLDPFDDQPFDPWAVADEQRRGPMARDAIRHLPTGKPAAQVRELLGEPGIVPTGGDPWGVKPRQTETWEYWLGCWSGLGPYGFDDASLYVHFGPDGWVVAVEIKGG